jgi:predicted RNase H-like HicB family nuclease
MLDVFIERDEDGWYIASVPALPGCHSQGESLEELMQNVKEAANGMLLAGAVLQPVNFVAIHRIEVYDP